MSIKKASKKKKNKKLKDLLEKVMPKSSAEECLSSIVGEMHPGHWSDVAFDDRYRTITVLAKEVSWFDGTRQRYKMEPGRMAAQVGHAVSKLKMNFCLTTSQDNLETLKSAVVLMENNPITSIILEARDERELVHISNLCTEKNIPIVEFLDDNENIYGPGIKVFTAISIGPVKPEDVEGITDYLPLWKPEEKL